MKTEVVAEEVPATTVQPVTGGILTEIGASRRQYKGG